jgi:hypothetical protein
MLLTLPFGLQYLSESCFGNDINFLLPNPSVVLFCFSFTKVLLTQNFVYPTLFSSVPPPAINNNRFLKDHLNELYTTTIKLRYSEFNFELSSSQISSLSPYLRVLTCPPPLLRCGNSTETNFHCNVFFFSLTSTLKRIVQRRR